MINQDSILRFILSLAVLLLPISMSCAFAYEDNVVISDEIRVFTIFEKNGEPTSVKSETDTYYTAQNDDETITAFAVYDDNVTIDKATAPGAKPNYRSLESPDVFYDGSRVCHMRVPLAKGKKTKVTFHQTYKLPELFCEEIIPSPSYKVCHSKIIIKVPAALSKRIKVTPYDFSDNITLNAETQANGAVTYTVESTDLNRWKRERFAPSATVSAPRIVITGQFADATALYRHLKRYVDEPDYDDPEIAKTAAQLRMKASTDIALIDSTALWVQNNIRYLAVEHNEYAFRPSSPSEVIRSRAGDCKGSANLIKALLRKNGLDGRLAWIGTQGKIAYDWDKVPALCSGNHVIAACVLPDTIIYLDGTAMWSSPGYVSPGIRGRRVMIENGDDCLITNVGNHYQNRDGESLTAKFIIDGNDLKGDVRLVLSGVNKMTFLSALSDMEPRDRQKIINRFVAYPKNNSEVSNPKVDADLSKESVVIEAALTETNSAQRIGDKIYVDLKPIRDSFFTTVETKNRERSYLQPYSYSANYDFEIEIPVNYKIHSMPNDIHIDNDWHDASITYSCQDGVLRCSVAITTRGLEVALNQLDSRNEAVKSALRLADSKVVLSPVID